MDKLEIKATLGVDDAGTITGIAWPFGAPDSVGDIITKGAFNIAVPDVPMLFGHDPEDLVGLWDEITETSEGLQVKGRLFINEHRRAKAVRALVSGGLISGLSIGFRTNTATPRPSTKGRIITSLDLLEVSIVRNPAHPGARVTSAKTAPSVAVAIAEAINRAALAFRT